MILENRKKPFQQQKPKSGPGSGKKIRLLNLPKIQYSAKSYDECIDWKSPETEFFEPPYLRDFSVEDIKKLEENPLIIPVHSNTQYVERTIRVINAVGKRAATLKIREGRALALIKDRKEKP